MSDAIMIGETTLHLYDEFEWLRGYLAHWFFRDVCVCCDYTKIGELIEMPYGQSAGSTLKCNSQGLI